MVVFVPYFLTIFICVSDFLLFNSPPPHRRSVHRHVVDVHSVPPFHVCHHDDFVTATELQDFERGIASSAAPSCTSTIALSVAPSVAAVLVANPGIQVFEYDRAGCGGATAVVTATELQDFERGISSSAAPSCASTIAPAAAPPVATPDLRVFGRGKAAIAAREKIKYKDTGKMNVVCPHCGALHWMGVSPIILYSMFAPLWVPQYDATRVDEIIGHFNSNNPSVAHACI